MTVSGAENLSHDWELVMSSSPALSHAVLRSSSKLVDATVGGSTHSASSTNSGVPLSGAYSMRLKNETTLTPRFANKSLTWATMPGRSKPEAEKRHTLGSAAKLACVLSRK